MDEASLWSCARDGDILVIKDLLERGANIDERDPERGILSFRIWRNLFVLINSIRLHSAFRCCPLQERSSRGTSLAKRSWSKPC